MKVLIGKDLAEGIRSVAEANGWTYRKYVNYLLQKAFDKDDAEFWESADAEAS